MMSYIAPYNVGKEGRYDGSDNRGVRAECDIYRGSFVEGEQAMSIVLFAVVFLWSVFSDIAKFK